jgi:phosphatidylglycerol:prolipoprotein diacylglycerol transferase
LRIGTFEITSFGVMVAMGALVGLWLFNRESHRAGLGDRAFDAAIAGIAGGMLGAKLIWALEHAGDEPFANLLFSRGGMSWYGGFGGGVLAGLFVMQRRKLSKLAVLAAAAPALAVGHAIGRIGCFLVGDDYGWPTDLPWGVAFPQGLPPTDVPVHPTQLYEAAGLAAIAIILLRLRAAGRPDAVVLGRYLMLAGALRFAVEFVRVHEPILGPFAVAHLASLAAIAVGAVLTARKARARG